MRNTRLESAIGLDVGGTSLKLVRIDGAKLALSRTIPIPRDRETFLATIARELASLREAGAPDLPVGIALPGFLDEHRRRIVRLSNLPFLDGLDLVGALAKLGHPDVALDTDTNAGATAEAVLGAGRDARRVLYVSLGTGLGAALTDGGRPVRVRNHTVGQVAFVPIAKRGAEELLCERGILARAGKRFGTARELSDRAAAGDPDARRAWRETGAMLGQLLAILCALWQPDVAVIGGGIAQSSEHFLDATRDELAQALSPAACATVLAVAQLLPYSGAIGAAVIARGK